MGIGCCIAEIACFVLGIVALVKGEIQLSANRVVRAGPARIVGVLLLPLIIGQGGAFVYGFAVGANKGIQMAQQGKQGFNEADKAALEKEIQTPALVIALAGSLLPLLLALVIALATAGPRRPVRHDYDDDDDEDDRPHRRRSRHDDEDEEDEDDRPRRRRRDDDDDRADEHIKEQ